MTKDQALKMALEALEEVVKWYQLRDKYDKPMPPHNQNPEIKQAIEAITAIKEALAQKQEQEQEPVAYIQVSKTGNVMACAKTGDFYKLPDKTLLYTSPQPAPVQEPVAWWNDTGTHIDLNVSGRGTPLYTTPPQRKPLTDEEIEDIWKQAISQDNGRNAHLSNQPFVHIARAIEAAHGIKD